jgi:putative ABC transport system substrate-binding protein
MRRRAFIAALGGAAAWPLVARAQQPERVRRIGVLVNLAADDPESQARVGAFLQGLQELGWAIGRNVRIEYRWAADAVSIPRYAAELVALAPDVILANANPNVEALQRATSSLPIVFVAATEPAGSGLVESMARPGGNATGFAAAEFGTSAKWLELLKEIAPRVTRVAVLQDPTAGGTAQFAAIQSAAGSYRVDLSSLSVHDGAEIERSITAFVRTSSGGLIVARQQTTITHRDLIIELATRHHLPTVYPLRLFVTRGGLFRTDPILSTSTGARPVMSIVSSRARSPPIFRCRRRTSTSSSSTSRPPRRSDSKYLSRCSPSPTR